MLLRPPPRALLLPERGLVRLRPRAILHHQQSFFMGGGVVISAPVTDLITTSGSGTATCPAGSHNRCRITIKGSAGGGGWQNHIGRLGAGGGGGGYCQKIVTVAAGDQINYALGTSGFGAASSGTAGTSAGTSTVSGGATGGFVGTSLQVTGGGGGPATGSGGAGGVATGGDTNTNGGAGGASQVTGDGSGGAGASGAPNGTSGVSNADGPAQDGPVGSIEFYWYTV